MGMMKTLMGEGAVGGVSSASGNVLILEEKAEVRYNGKESDSDSNSNSDSEIEDKGIRLVSAPAKSQIHTESGPSLNKPSTTVGASLNKPSAATASTERSEPDVVIAIDPERSEETQEEVKAMNTGTEQGFENDLGLWPKIIQENVCDYWLKRGSAECQHCDGDFKESAVKELIRTRHCTKTLFTRTHSLSGQEINLNWLCYSKTTGKVYCFPCKLLSKVQSSFTTGFNGWKNARYIMESHSRSDQHRKSMVDMIYRKTTGACIDSNLVLQYESDCEYWQAVLRRCVDVLKLLCERGLPIRGKDEVIGSAHNGNYLGILELLSIYDSFLEAHIKKHANKGSGHTSYLSHDISKEVIGIMAE
ncbi:uncharacterized protein [Palaemon carinicauda]|uniref:uncharacterized protein n=1 Tax=Palaemon carinicauda TaxID=392227 RepID=UPI0035B67779